MLFALVEDAKALEDATYQIAASPQELIEVAPNFDWCVIVAPETDEILSDFVRELRPFQAKLLGPNLAATQLATDKLTLANFWTQHGVSTPRTWAFNPVDWEDDHFPVVVKPRDGVGSQATQLIPMGDYPSEEMLAWEGDLIVQEYHKGIPASVSFLCGPNGNVPLLPFRQILSDDGTFQYLGGEILEPELHERAIRIASQALENLTGLQGYVGVDIVLGKTDVAIEINPRLTTSYVGLRVASEKNLLAGMIAVAQGQEWSPQWKAGRVSFTPDGKVQA